MQTRVAVFAVVAAVLFAAGATHSAGAEEIRVNGGGAAINSVFQPVKAAFEQKTGIKLKILQNSPTAGLVDLVQGRADTAVAAVGLEGRVKGAEAQGVKIDAASLQQTAVANNRTVVLVHRDNRIATLTKEQVRGIFTGRITNWKDVGGTNTPIIVVWGKATPGQNALFTKEILDGESVAKDVLDATDYAGIKDTVAATPGSIGIDPASLADASVRIPDAPALTSPVIMVTQGAPSPSVQKLIDFIKGEGQQYVRK